MFKIVYKTDVLRVVATRDSLAAALEEAYVQSKAMAAVMGHESCWVEVRDVKDVVLRRVNYWVEKHREGGNGEV